MVSEDRKKRFALSCDPCRVRKRRCIRLSNGSCRKCAFAGEECVTSSARSSRPYYQTSKEQFELMSAIVRNFLPEMSEDMDTEDLRTALSHLRETSNSCASITGDAPFTPFTSGLPGPSILPRRGYRSDDIVTRTHIAEENVGRAALSNSGAHSMSQRSKGTSLPGNPDHELIFTQVLDSPMEGVASPEERNRSEEMVYPDVNGSPRFDNGSGFGSFFRRVQSNLLSPSVDLSLRRECERGFNDGRRIATVPTDKLPDRSRVEKAIIKFVEVNSVLFIISYEASLNAVEQLYSSKGVVNNSTVAMILAIVALTENTDQSFQQACQYYDIILAESNLEGVQALLLLVLCRLNREERNSAWILLGCAVRMAKSLGLHSGTGSIESGGPHHAEMNKRLWYSLRDLDIDLACNIGRVPECQDSIRLGNSMTAELCTNPNTPPGYSVASARLGDIAYRILTRLFSKQSEADWSNASLDMLLEELDSWWRSLPPYLKPHSQAAPVHLRAICYLNLRYNHYSLLLTRPFLLLTGTADGNKAKYALRCEQTVRQSIELLNDLAMKGLLSKIHYQDAMFILGCGMILFAMALRRASPGILAELSAFNTLLSETHHWRIGRRATKVMMSLIEERSNARIGSSCTDGIINTAGGTSAPTWPEAPVFTDDFWESILDGSFDGFEPSIPDAAEPAA